MPASRSRNRPSTLAPPAPPVHWRQEIVKPALSALRRDRLLGRLGERFERRLTVVHAGAGFGKSTLLSQAIEENRLARAGTDWSWRCTAEDASPERLALALCAMAGLDPPDEWGDVPRLVAERVWSGAPGHVALLFDDAHLLWPDGQSPELLVRLLDELPTNGHLVVATRTEPPLPIGRLAASGALLALRDADLCFSPDELDAFRRLRGVAVDHTGVVWPALAELSIAGGNGPQVFVWEQVLSGLSVTAREALWWLVVLDGADDALVSAAMRRHVRLRDLLGGIPLVTRDGAQWRAHGLWAEHADRLRGADSDPDGIRAAAVLITERDDHARALRLLARHGDWPAVRSVVRRACAAVEPLVPFLELKAWTGMLPAGREDGPEGLLLRAMVARAEDVSTAVALLRAAAEAFRGRGDVEGELVALAQLGRTAYWTGAIDVAGGVLTRVLELEVQGIPGADALATMGRGLVALVLGNDQEALRIFRGVALDGRNPDVEMMVIFTLTALLVSSGWVDEAMAVSQLGMDRATRGQRGLALNGRANALWAAGDTVIEELYTELLALDTAAKLGHNVIYTNLRVAMGAAFLGDVAIAERYVEAALSAPHSLGAAYDDFLGNTARVLVALAHGDESGAASILESSAAIHSLEVPRIRRTLTAAPAIAYVLAPDVRVWLEAQANANPDLYGPHFHAGLNAARALLRLRGGARLGPSDAGLATQQIRSMLPIGWAIELAAGLHAAGESDAALFIVKLHEERCRPWLERLLAHPQRRVSRAARALSRFVAHAPGVPVAVSVLGPIRVHLGDGVEDAAAGLRPDARSLLGHLIVSRRVPRHAVAAALWPGSDAPAAEAKLRAAIRSLDSVLEPARPRTARPYFVRDDGTDVWIAPSEYLRVDLWECESLLEEAADALRNHVPSKALDQLLAALDLDGGDLLPELPDAPWAVEPRAQLRASMADAAVRAGQLLVGAGEFQRALALAALATASHPLMAAAHWLAAEAHELLGDRASARTAALIAAHSLGSIPPDPQSRALLLRLGATGDGLPSRSGFGWSSLTPAEHTVTAMLEEGLTNRGIAARLGVSVRTIDAHLSHVFTKLGVHSRAQLAAEAARRAVNPGAATVGERR